MAGIDEDLGRSRRPGAEDRGWSNTSWVLGGRMHSTLLALLASVHIPILDVKCHSICQTSWPDLVEPILVLK
jgi:hypothetical protein